MSKSLEGQSVFDSILSTDPQAKPPSEEDEAELEQKAMELQQTAEHKLNAFLALSDPEKASWLSANWERLQSGDLTLDELP